MTYAPTRTYRSSASYTPTQTYVPSATYVPTQSYQSSASYTPTQAYVPSATYVPTQSYQSSASYTPTQTYVPSATYIPTQSYQSSASHTPTQTYVPSATYIPTQSYQTSNSPVIRTIPYSVGSNPPIMPSALPDPPVPQQTGSDTISPELARNRQEYEETLLKTFGYGFNTGFRSLPLPLIESPRAVSQNAVKYGISAFLMAPYIEYPRLAGYDVYPQVPVRPTLTGSRKPN